MFSKTLDATAESQLPCHRMFQSMVVSLMPGCVHLMNGTQIGGARPCLSP